MKLTPLAGSPPRIFRVSSADAMAAAAELIGLQFVELGRDPSVGLDCWGVACVLYERLCGVTLPEVAYGCTKPEEASEALTEGVTRWAQADAPEPLDVAIFNVMGLPCHVGVMLDGDRFIHAEPRAGVVLERISSALWRRRVRGYFYHAHLD